MENSMKIEFPSLSVNEKFARTAVAAFFTQLNPTLEEIEDIKTAVSEAVTNAVIHAYGETRGIITIECSYEADTAKITITDHGCGIENIDLARTPLFSGKEDSERSGLGFTVMETFMDDISVESSPQKGTTVTLIKKTGSYSPSSL